MRTSDPDIFACGDVAEVVNRITGQRVRLPLAGPANKEGRVAGSNAAGGNLRFPGVIGTSIVKVCDLSAGKTGLSEREARLAGLDPIVTYTHPSSHAEYFPGAQPMAMKLLADRESGRVLGAQIVGPEGVDKRIDVLATAIHAEMTVEDLEGLDLAYAPPYSSAKDPVVMAGFVAANQWRGEVEMVTVMELAGEMDAGRAGQAGGRPAARGLRGRTPAWGGEPAPREDTPVSEPLRPGGNHHRKLPGGRHVLQRLQDPEASRLQGSQPRRRLHQLEPDLSRPGGHRRTAGAGRHPRSQISPIAPGASG